MMLFGRKSPKTELEGIDKALEILNQRYEKKLITIEQYQAQALEFGKRREKCLKKLEKKKWQKF